MRTISVRRQIPVLAILATVLFGACAYSPTILRDTNPAATFGAYKTFGFFSPLATDRFAYESLLSQHFKDATRRMMESKGYVYSTSAPDLLVNFYVNVEDKQEIRSTSVAPAPYPGYYSGYYPGGYYGYRTGFYSGFNTVSVETINYKQGTLTIDLIDAKKKLLAWTALAEGRVPSSAIRDPGPAIDKLVTSMMEPVIAVH
jgi:hypothetical protein